MSVPDAGLGSVDEPEAARRLTVDSGVRLSEALSEAVEETGEGCEEEEEEEVEEVEANEKADEEGELCSLIERAGRRK